MKYLYTLLFVTFIGQLPSAYANFDCNSESEYGYEQVKTCEIVGSDDLLCVLDFAEEDQLTVALITHNSFSGVQSYDNDEVRASNDSIYASSFDPGIITTYKSKLEINADGTGMYHDYYRDISGVFGGDSGFKNEVLHLTNCKLK